LTILNGVHKHKMKPNLYNHLLVGILREAENKKVGELTKSLIHPLMLCRRCSVPQLIF